MAYALKIIAVICTLAVPGMIAAACVRAFNRKSAKYLIHGAIIMFILAAASFILSSMLNSL